jgi:hypothetical protein
MMKLLKTEREMHLFVHAWITQFETAPAFYMTCVNGEDNDTLTMLSPSNFLAYDQVSLAPQDQLGCVYTSKPFESLTESLYNFIHTMEGYAFCIDESVKLNKNFTPKYTELHYSKPFAELHVTGIHN